MKEYGIHTLGSDGLGPADSYWANTTFCFNASGEDGSTVFTDAKGNPIVAYGSLSISTVLGYPAVAFRALTPNEYLSISNHNAFLVGADDWTYDIAIRKMGNNANYSRLFNANGDVYNAMDSTLDESGNLTCYLSSNGTSWNLVSNANIVNIASNTDYFLRYVRSGGTFTVAVNGTPYVLTTGLGATVLNHSTNPRTFGGQPGTNRALNGYIRGIRMTLGVARPVTEVPTLPFPVR